jgi:serine/threonine protein kinase
MGEVYRATHRMLARPAAIKLIRPEAIGTGSAAELALRRFRREAEVAASLRSPHTVELYDFGVTENRTFFFVMELLDGLDLETLVRRHGPQPPSRVIHILRQVCDSLEEAHARGLVHRDIKPANIHIGRLGLRHDFVKVLDFGLVKAIDGDGAEHTLETGPNLTPGTPSYMAPEAALGEKIDGRTDLFAFGAVLFEMLAGVRAFQRETAAETMTAILKEDVQPSQRSGIPVPPRLERLILAMLGKRPDDRPATAGEWAASWSRWMMTHGPRNRPWNGGKRFELPARGSDSGAAECPARGPRVRLKDERRCRAPDENLPDWLDRRDRPAGDPSIDRGRTRGHGEVARPSARLDLFDSAAVKQAMAGRTR